VSGRLRTLTSNRAVVSHTVTTLAFGRAMVQIQSWGLARRRVGSAGAARIARTLIGLVLPAYCRSGVLLAPEHCLTPQAMVNRALTAGYYRSRFRSSPTGRGSVSPHEKIFPSLFGWRYMGCRKVTIKRLSPQRLRTTGGALSPARKH
jgi:hypothetical protein